MSSIVAQFDPGTSTSASFTAPQSAANGALVFWNESMFSLTLTFADGTNMYLPAWYHRHRCGPTGSVNIQWEVHTTLVSSSPPLSEMIVEAYAQGEQFPQDGPLVRQTNGDTTAVGGIATSVLNSGNPAGTNVVTGVPFGDLSAATLINNNGTAQFGSATRDGQVNVAGANSLLQVENRVTIGTDPQISMFGTTGDIFMEGGVHFQPGGNARGSITRVAWDGPFISATAVTNYPHTLGVVPTVVLFMTVGGSTTS